MYRNAVHETLNCLGDDQLKVTSEYLSKARRQSYKRARNLVILKITKFVLNSSPVYYYNLGHAISCYYVYCSNKLTRILGQLIMLDY
jgi:hypothetical protein